MYETPLQRGGESVKFISKGTTQTSHLFPTSCPNMSSHKRALLQMILFVFASLILDLES